MNGIWILSWRFPIKFLFVYEVEIDMGVVCVVTPVYCILTSMGVIRMFRFQISDV